MYIRISSGGKTKYRKYVRAVRLREPKFKELQDTLADARARNAREYKYQCHRVRVWPPFAGPWRWRLR
jgi:hypothetical protein